MKITLGFSPCPNDCFIFHALLHGKIDTEGLTFEVVMEDVEALNKKALKKELDVTKLSFHAFAYLTHSYSLLRAGSALGFNCGPLLISKRKLSEAELNSGKILVAIPGENTTANLLLTLAYPQLKNKTEIIFSDIEQLLLDDKIDAGLIIHESRFTYESKGLKKIMDLGEFWDSLIHSPIPLGGIFIKNDFSTNEKQKVNRVIRRSVEYAFSNPDASTTFVSANAQEMSKEVMKKHIELYVNSFSIDLGAVGLNAVELLLKKAKETGLINHYPTEFYVPEST